MIFRADVNGRGGVRLGVVHLEVLEDLGGAVGRGRPRPNDAHTLPGEDEEGEICVSLILLLVVLSCWLHI